MTSGTGLLRREPAARSNNTEPFHGFAGQIAVATQHAADAERLREAGADLVFLPFQDAADRAVDLMLGGELTQRTLDATEVQEVHEEVA